MDYDIIEFLKSGPKGTDDFRNSESFFDDKKERGIYPRKLLHLLLDMNIVEKYYEDRKVKWKLVNTLQGKTVDIVVDDPLADIIKEDNTPIPDFIAEEVEMEIELTEEIEKFPYLKEQNEVNNMPDGLSWLERRRWKKSHMK